MRRLTKAQMDLLRRAVQCVESGLDGVAVYRRGPHIRALVQSELIAYVGVGTCEDDPEPVYRDIYAPTDAGRALIEEARNG